LQTIQFLQCDATQTQSFKQVLSDYRHELLRLRQGDHAKLLELKSKLEYQLRRVMVRTERLAASPDRNGMLTEIPCHNTKLDVHDLEHYLTLQKIARLLGHHDTLEYWKSAPYLLNFMDSYQFKQLFAQAVNQQEQSAALANAIAHCPNLLLSHQDFESYAKLDPCNARLRGLLADTVDIGSWKLLWIPPSLPYHQLNGVFAQSGLNTFTKRLIFSSWQVVPKVIATLLSYEAERQMFRAFEDAPQNTSYW
jgi:hypothetical protein